MEEFLVGRSHECDYPPSVLRLPVCTALKFRVAASSPGPRLAESLEILAEIIHPEVFSFGHEGTGWQAL